MRRGNGKAIRAILRSDWLRAVLSVLSFLVRLLRPVRRVRWLWLSVAKMLLRVWLSYRRHKKIPDFRREFFQLVKKVMRDFFDCASAESFA